MADNPLTESEIQELKSSLKAFKNGGDESNLEVVFKILDRNGNGVIQAEELKAINLQAFNNELSDDEVQEKINEADTNGDGVIQLSEFIERLKSER
mmetsp:Transcript_9232/g.13720  ORF Transcript_9232/g.13720 Transcript_9232/m.13720 type:complete len:96 (-) Transcript_9232:436-723(-)